jgi:hypothetical protein
VKATGLTFPRAGCVLYHFIRPPLDQALELPPLFLPFPGGASGVGETFVTFPVLLPEGGVAVQSILAWGLLHTGRGGWLIPEGQCWPKHFLYMNSAHTEFVTTSASRGRLHHTRRPSSTPRQ